MKSLIVKLTIAIAILLYFSPVAKAQFYTDPALLAAITAVATPTEKKALNEIKDTQKQITGTQLAINTQLNKIKDIQDRTHKCLTNISAAVTNAHDIKKAAYLIIDIKNLCGELTKAVRENPQGIITTSIATQQIKQIQEEMFGIYAYINGLVLNKDVLMDPGKRLVITGQVTYRLDKLKFKVYRLVYSTYAYSFKDLPRLLVPDIYYDAMTKKSIAEGIIKRW